jgi:RNA recognition motif-containing protein
LANGSELKARKLRVDMVRRNIEEFNPKSVYISNINLNTTEMELGKFFEKYGDVKTVKLLDPKNDKSLCSGYVNFSDT